MTRLRVEDLSFVAREIGIPVEKWPGLHPDRQPPSRAPGGLLMDSWDSSRSGAGLAEEGGMDMDTITEARVRAARVRHARGGEQAFQVEHFLALWKSDPTADNWQRVIDAAEGYYPGGDIKPRVRRGERVYFTFDQPGGKPDSNRKGLGRHPRVGSRGKLYTSFFRKGKQNWTVAR